MPEISILSTIFGIMVGVIGTIITSYIKGQYDFKKELLKSAVESGHKDFEAAVELRKNLGEQTRVYPLSVYISFHREFLLELNKSGSPELAAEAALNKIKSLLLVYKKSGLSSYNEDWSTE